MVFRWMGGPAHAASHRENANGAPRRRHRMRFKSAQRLRDAVPSTQSMQVPRVELVRRAGLKRLAVFQASACVFMVQEKRSRGPLAVQPTFLHVGLRSLLF